MNIQIREQLDGIIRLKLKSQFVEDKSQITSDILSYLSGEISRPIYPELNYQLFSKIHFYIWEYNEET